MTLYDLALVGLLLVTLALAWVAAAAETALTSVSRIKLRRLADAGDPHANLIQKLHANPNDYLTAILTTNTTAIIISATAAGLIGNNHGYSAFVPQLVISLVDAVIVLVFCEITAKTLALRYNMVFAQALAPTVAMITSATRYPIRAMSAFARLVARPAGGARGPFVTEDELKMLVTVGEEEGIIEEEEREMIHGVIEIGDMMVREVMIPRIDIVAVEVGRPVEEIVQLVLKHGHTRIPVYEESIDHIVGVAYAKDLLRYSAQRRPATAARTNGDLRKVMRTPYFVPENKNLSEFLHEMRENRVHMAMVIDEHGQTAGIITIEDIIEEIVGPIRDEYDAMEEEEIQFLAPNEAVLDARVSLADARDELGLVLAAEDVDSLGGFIYSHLGTIPRAGEVVDIEGVTMTVASVRGQRIGKVRVRSERPFPGAQRRDEDRADAETAQRGQAQAAQEARNPSPRTRA
ncbi:MAG: hemolysin family protein [Candidatus Dormibacteraeota bacterium]|nr:hemolysin family protein [Candidatus Dormibacteraeota bacterium]